MGRQKVRRVRQTLLVVAEGDTEVAFLKHLRDMYCSGGFGVNVTVRNAHGKGPENVVSHAVRQLRMYSYDACVAMLDTDLPWSKQVRQQAKDAKVAMIGSRPCFEGLLLAILKRAVPEQSQHCKNQAYALLGLDLTDRQSYQALLPKPLLQEARVRIPELCCLLEYLEGSRSG